MGRLPIGNGESVRYWSDVVVAADNQLFIPFFDHRRAHGIENSAMRQVVFSMQHLWVRERMPDLAEARLAVVRFPQYSKSREIEILLHNESDFLPYELLDDKVRIVYETWARASAEKRSGTRMTGTGGDNPFRF
ncbi:MAG TPA: hypothetical protein VFA50_21185 [Stellaceae bacterium]|nr:hypothetical protein [Stellaceae bacterium]